MSPRPPLHPEVLPPEPGQRRKGPPLLPGRSEPEESLARQPEVVEPAPDVASWDERDISPRVEGYQGRRYAIFLQYTNGGERCCTLRGETVEEARASARAELPRHMPEKIREAAIVEIKMDVMDDVRAARHQKALAEMERRGLSRRPARFDPDPDGPRPPRRGGRR